MADQSTEARLRELVERDAAQARKGVMPLWRTSHDALVREAVNALPSLLDELTRLRTEVEARDEIVEAARDLVMKPGGLVNRGVGVGLVVVEKANKSDPHYRLCTAFERFDARTTLNGEQANG